MLGEHDVRNATLSTPIPYVFPAWVALVSIVLLVRRPQLAPEERPPSS